ncbi:MAG: hypothetical protein ABIH24_08320 [Verrucomicrobiota bacterium]
MNFQFPISNFQFWRSANACKILLAVLGLAALFSAGLAIRRVVLSAQFEQYGRPLPFNLESALEFRYVRMLFDCPSSAGDTWSIPRLDKAVQAPEGVVVRETYTLGAEYVYAAIARLFPRTLPLDERVRWIAAAWFCLGIPLMSLWLWAWKRSIWAAGIAGAYYAVALAAVMRSTGQELQHENFALPFLIAHWALGAWANRIGKANSECPTPNAECLKTDARRQPAHRSPLGEGGTTDPTTLKELCGASAGPNPDLSGEALAKTEYRTKNEERRTKNAFFVLSLLSALMLACAVSFWDLMQYYIILWGIWSYVRFVAGKYFRDARACLAWGLILMALAGAGVLNPYLRAHAFTGSFAMLLAYGVALGLGVEWLFRWIGIAKIDKETPTGTSASTLNNDLLGWRPGSRRAVSCPLARRRWRMPLRWRPASLPAVSCPALRGRINVPIPGENGRGQHCFRRMLVLALIALLPLIAGALWSQQYGETYGHFIELLWAKLRFFNHKPADPALLTFNQRILWTAPLNSATFRLTANLFPATLCLSVLAGIIAVFHVRAHPDPEINQLLSYTVISLLAFVLFMRFHVFLILGFAALLGWLGYWVNIKRNFTRWLILVLLLAGVGVEAAHVLNNPVRWGSVPVYLDEKKALCRWLRSNTAGESVLANFGLSSFLLAYANCPIVLHPKFEAPGIRERVRAYGEALFKSSEDDFRAWMEPLGAPYYVYALGEFADVQPESQMRYCVNALNPPPLAAARLFEKKPAQCRYFQFLWGNAKYRVFRVITRADELSAGRLAAEAALALRQGRRTDAENKATQALMYDPQNTNAMQVLLRMR